MARRSPRAHGLRRRSIHRGGEVTGALAAGHVMSSQEAEGGEKLALSLLPLLIHPGTPDYGKDPFSAKPP